MTHQFDNLEVISVMINPLLKFSYTVKSESLYIESREQQHKKDNVRYT